MIRFRSLLASTAVAFACMAATGLAGADDGAQGFVQKEQQKLAALLRQPQSDGRDSQIDHELDTLVDYDELVKRSFGEPCPHGLDGCVNYRAQMNEAQRIEVRDLLRALIRKNYKKNLERTLDYDITYKDSKDLAGETKVRTEAKSKTKPRDPAVQVDYVVHGDGGKYRVVDIVTESSSTTKNYYDQFDKKFKAHAGDFAGGYAEIVQKLRDKLSK